MEEVEKIEIEEIEEIKETLITLNQKMDDMYKIIRKIHSDTKGETVDFGPW